MEQRLTEESGGFGVWAILELMGHVKLAGFITEEELFGGKMGRIDIPGEGDSSVTQYFGGHTIYRLTPVTEALARAFAARNRPRPVHLYELPEWAERSGVLNEVQGGLEELGEDDF